MKALFMATAVLLVSLSHVCARLMEVWTYQKLLEKSDLVVIANPTAVIDTKEEIDLPGYSAMRATGVETHFQISAVFKGEKNLKDFTMHHYRASKPDIGYPNGPNLVSFDPTQKHSYIIFLIREADGRYAPTCGQTDPAFYAAHAIEGGLK